ncbi:hypothetical protein KI387_039973, partial [Taxus chinensis]
HEEEVAVEEIEVLTNDHRIPEETETVHAQHEEDIVTKESEEETTAVADDEEQPEEVSSETIHATQTSVMDTKA